MARIQNLKNDLLSFAAVSSVLMMTAAPVASASEDSKINSALSLQAAIAAELQGIAGTGLQGIAGTGLQGIAGTGLQGIAGTGLQGIAGTGLQGIAGTGLQGIAGTGLQGMPIVAYGPVEEVLDNGYVVLGQFVATLNEAALLTLSVGDVVAVFGLVSEHGLVSDQIVKLQEASIDGSSLVFVAGIVDAVNTAVGEFAIGELTVKIGSAGANPETFEIQSGQYVEVVGLRFGRVMVAQAIEASPAVL
jgi:hypothetical protein